jgi:hypothetical protein
VALDPKYHLVIGNKGTGAETAYVIPGSRVVTPIGTQITLTASAGAPPEDHVKLGPGFRFWNASSSKRMFMVHTPIT